MAYTKKQYFSEDLQQLAALMKVLSHPARLAILQLLAEKKECICGELVHNLPLAQSTVSQHLRELKQAGLIQGEIEGVKICYCLNWENIERLDQLTEKFIAAIIRKKPENTCC
ncbi:MAG: metalloregulator ArsR/SmtB family transcription factor [Flavobacteriales bacterium]|nr:metalloregulator ArsR/SmtB family transcription factor [Flavobacteriales bacterium]